MISSGSVRLRTTRRDDLDMIYRLISDLDSWEQRMLTPPAALTREAFDAWYLPMIDDRESAEFVIEADVSAGGGTPEALAVGRCALFEVDTHSRHGEIGIGLLPEFTGRGYGTDAVRGLVEFAFRRRNLHRLGLGVLATNARAIASYHKVGFVDEGRIRQLAWVDGEYVDELRMGLLRSDWLAPHA